MLLSRIGSSKWNQILTYLFLCEELVRIYQTCIVCQKDNYTLVQITKMIIKYNEYLEVCQKSKLPVYAHEECQKWFNNILNSDLTVH